MPMDRSKYPPDWDEIAEQVKEQAGTSFAVLPMDKPDIQLMGIMSEAFDRYAKEMPRRHLEAAMNWFVAYAKAKLSDDSSS